MLCLEYNSETMLCFNMHWIVLPDNTKIRKHHLKHSIVQENAAYIAFASQNNQIALIDRAYEQDIKAHTYALAGLVSFYATSQHLLNVQVALAIDDERFFYVSILDGYILPSSSFWSNDCVGDEETIRTLFIKQRETGRFEKGFAPATWQIQNTSEIQLEQLLRHTKQLKQSQVKRLVSNKKKIVIGLVLLLMVMGIFCMTHYQQSITQFFMPTPTVIQENKIQSTMQEPMNTYVIQAFYDAFHRVPIWPKHGFELSEVVLDGLNFTVKWKQKDDEELDAAFVHHRQISLDNKRREAFYKKQLDMPTGYPEPLLTKQDALYKLYCTAKNLDLHLVIDDKSNHQKSVNTSVNHLDKKNALNKAQYFYWEVANSVLPAEDFLHVMQGGGARVKLIRLFKKGDAWLWHVKGVHYVK